MTRESKLALIIGFVLVLVVGVLVSDHFSQASTTALDAQKADSGQVISPITDLGSREKQVLDQAIDQAITSPLAGQMQDQTQPPIVIQNGRGGSETLAGAESGGDSIIDRALQEARRRVQETELPLAAQYTIERDPEPRGVDRPQPRAKYSAYTVVSGDTLIGLARRFLNDGERWPEIHRLNADVLGPDAILQIGMKLKVPAGDTPSSTTSLQTGAGSSSSSSSSASPRTYTVVAGDTLGEISMKLLGTSRRIDELVRLNKLKSADDIWVGMKLKVPGR